MKSLNVWLATGLLWWLGCGGVPQEAELASPAPSLEQVEQDLDACTAASITWPSTATASEKVCAGPWEYGLACYNLAADNNCEISGYQPKTCYPKCRHPDFGLDHRETRSYSQVPVTCQVIKEYVCDDSRKPPCQWETYYDCYAACDAYVSSEIQKIDSRYRTGVYSSTPSVSGYGPGATCTFSLSNYPIYKEDSGPQCGAGYACDTPIYYACRAAAHGLASPGSCGPDLRYTAPGLSQAQAEAEAQTRWTQLQDKVASTQKTSLTYSRTPRCTTCEDRPLANSADAASKYACLDSGLNQVGNLPSGSAPSGVDRAALEKQLIYRLKLLYELYGHGLTPQQRERVRNLYVTRPDAEPACGVDFVPPVGVDASCNTAELDNLLDMCTRLTGAHVPAESSYVSIDACVDLAARVAPLDLTLCKGTEYRDAYNNVWLSLLEHSSRNLQRDASGVPQRADLQARLATINRWYGVVRGSLYPGQPAPGELWRNVSRTSGSLWKVAYEGGLLTSDGSQVSSSVVDPFNIGLSTDRALLDAALTPVGSTGQLPLQGPPLLTLLGDGLRGLHERVEDFSALHDLGCRFKDCKAAQVRTEVSDVWALFGSLADETAFQAAVNNASLLRVAPARRQAWWTLFDMMRMRHADLRSAVNATFGDSVYSADRLTRTPPESIPEPALQLASFIQNGRNRTSRYQASGTFLTEARNALRIGIQETRQELLNSQITSRQQALDAAINDYNTNRQAYAAARVAEMNNAQQTNTLRAQLEQLLTRFSQQAGDLTGLRESTAREDAAFGDFSRVYNQALEEEQADLANLRFNREPATSLSISAGDAPGSIPSFLITNLAVTRGGTSWKLSANPGDLVNVGVSGRWAPACALSQHQLRRPDDPLAGLIGVDVSNALTGPEGYLVTYQNGTFATRSNNTSEYSVSSTAERKCVGFRTEAGVSYSGIGHFASYAYFNIDQCWNDETGTRTSTDSTLGRDSRLTAAFNTGIRVPTTPFPGLPAGSLLLVQMEKGGAGVSDIRDIRVLQAPNTSVVIGSRANLQSGQTDPGVDVYLVVNDTLMAGCTPDTTNSLSVNVQRLEPAGTVAQQLGGAMARTLTGLRASTGPFLAQGRVSPQELTALRDNARAQLQLACGQCDLNQFPRPLMALYDAFVSREAARLERAVESRSVERQMELMTLQAKALADDLDSATTQGRLLRLVPAWSLRNLDGEQLRESTRSLRELVSNYLYPVMDLRYPSALGALRNEPALTNLIQADWTQSFVDTASLARTAVSQIRLRLDEARLNDPSPAYTRVALSFVRPGATVVSPWTKASAQRAMEVWSQLPRPSEDVDPTRPLRFTLQLTPEDFYTALGGTAAQLQCTEGTPILSRVALFWSRPGSSAGSNTNLNTQVVRASTSFSPELTFTGESGLKRYRMESPSWLVGPTRMLFGLSTEALSMFQTYELGLDPSQQTTTGDGLSPFTAMQFDVTGFRNLAPNPLSDANELVVVMQVDRRSVASLYEPALCRP